MQTQKSIPAQRPFSYAYIVTDPQRGPQNIPRINESPLKRELKDAMQHMKMSKEDIAEILDDIGAEEEATYAEYLKTEYRKRAKEDTDYDEERQKYLKKFISGDK